MGNIFLFFYLLLGCQYGNFSQEMGDMRRVLLLFILLIQFFLFFSVSVKVLPVTPLLSGVFVHRVFCSYFVWFEEVGGNA